MINNIVAKEGQFKALYFFLAFIVFVILGLDCLSIISFAVIIYLLFIYRIKSIRINNLKDKNIYAPISGTISAIDVKDLKKQIYIDVSILDLHNLRALEDNLESLNTKKGLNLCLNSFKSKNLNENTIFKYPNTKMILLSSFFTNELDVSFNKKTKKGELIGTFLHGQIIVSLNDNLLCEVNIGDKIRSGESIIASLK